MVGVSTSWCQYLRCSVGAKGGSDGVGQPGEVAVGWVVPNEEWERLGGH